MLDNFKDNLFQTDSISITFEFQKNQETVTQERSTDLDLCPVWSAASIIMHIVCMPGASTDTSINSFHDNSGKTVLISSAVVVSILGEAAATMGGVLGFSPADIRCHSICSTCAMALYLVGLGVATIMLIGRWRSYLFLRYIRKQVQQFSYGISSQMIQREHFFTIPRL